MAINMERIQKIPVAQKALAVGGLIILAWVGYIVLWLLDQQKEIKDLDKKLADLNQKVAKGMSVKQDIAKFEAIQKDLELRLKEAEKKLPRQAEIPDLLEKVSDLARGNHLVFSTFHPDLKTVGGCDGMCEQIFIVVNLQGRYSEIATFLDQVSKLDRIINIDKIKFTPKKFKEEANFQSILNEEKEDKIVDTDEIVISSDVKLITYMFRN